jgi:hypothetical protein
MSDIGTGNDAGNADRSRLPPLALEALRTAAENEIVFRDTHICPVNQCCPPEMIEIGASLRCGLCPLACAGYDHLTAISAKIRQLLETIMALRKAYRSLVKAKTEESELLALYDRIDLEKQEYWGWRLKEEIIWNMRLQGQSGARGQGHDPDGHCKTTRKSDADQRTTNVALGISRTA